jgi:hypothetical protein
MAAFIEAFLIFIFYSSLYATVLAMARAKAPRDITSRMDLSWFDAALLTAFIATQETEYGTETDGRIPSRCSLC